MNSKVTNYNNDERAEDSVKKLNTFFIFIIKEKRSTKFWEMQPTMVTFILSKNEDFLQFTALNFPCVTRN